VSAIGIDFRGTTIPHLSFDESDLEGSIFDESSIWASTFRGSNLLKSTFRKTTISESDFIFAALDGADFAGAELYCNRFNGASLTGASFSNVDWGARVFWGDRTGTRARIQMPCNNLEYAVGVDESVRERAGSRDLEFDPPHDRE
jgi:hypothetical protein